MINGHQIIVCAGIVPDPLQTLEPAQAAGMPALKNEMMLPAVLDTWASHALYEAAHLAAKSPGSKVWLVSVSPKAKLQQVMMAVAQKAQFELLAADCPANGFTDAYECAAVIADMIKSIPNLDRERLFVFGGWESASRGAGVTLQIVGELLGIRNQFQGVDELKINEDGSFDVYERISEGKHQISRCAKLPAVLGWATGNLPEPKNNPQIGMMNMRTIMPALQKAKVVKLENKNIIFDSVQLPKQERTTRIVKDVPVDEIAREIVEWLKQ
ncbi:MAG: electron transfer flavoprotein subunit beta [Verrucomicrobiia bacterium]